MSVLDSRVDVYGQSIILSCIEKNELLFVAKERIKPDDFITANQRNVWNKMLTLYDTGTFFDLATICNPNTADNIDFNDVSKWIMRDEFYGIDINAFRSRCDDFVNLVDRQKSGEWLRKVSTMIVDGNIKTGHDISTKLSELADKTFRLHPIHDDKQSHEYIRDDIKELTEVNKHGEIFGIKSIDEKLGKLAKRQFVLIAARPGGGKSSIMLSPIEQFCRKGKSVVLNTIEMTRAEVNVRILARLSNVQMNKLIGIEPMTDYEAVKVSDSIDVYKNWDLTIKDSGLRTIEDIDTFLTLRAARKNPVDLFVIDHFGLLRFDGRSNGRYSDYTTISNNLKVLAKKHQCTMLVLSQLNRNKQPNERPTMNDLRDSGSLEQDADKILFLWNDDGEERIVNVGIAKNRQGEMFETKLKFYPSTMSYYDVKPF